MTPEERIKFLNIMLRGVGFDISEEATEQFLDCLYVVDEKEGTASLRDIARLKVVFDTRRRQRKAEAEENEKAGKGA